MKIHKLEAIRGFAALYVVFHHIFSFTELRSILGPVYRFPFRFGQEAVILFFLMSGFVICVALKRQKKTEFKSYFTKRFARIYPIAMISFLVSAIVLLFNGGFLQSTDYTTLLGNLFMLQDTDNKPGLLVPTFLENHSLWSLSYEWWFYMMYFPLMVWMEKYSDRITFPKIYLILVISALSWISYLFYPNHISLIISYLVLWWAGVACAEVYMEKKDFPLADLKPILISLFVMTCLATIPVITTYLDGLRTFSQIKYPIIAVRHFGFALVVLMIGYFWWKAKMVAFDALLKPFAEIASISYALYIIHFPIMWLKLPGISNIYAETLIKLAMMFIIAYLLEIKLQPIISSWFFSKRSKLTTSPLPS